MNQNALARTFPRGLRLWVIAVLLAGLANLAVPPPPARAATIIVDTTLDTIDANGGICAGMVIADLPGGDGLTSLREAICASNGDPVGAPHTITFNIGGGGVQTIAPGSALPTITRPVTIDGTTQLGFVDTPIIVLNGSGAGAGVNGLTISAGSSTVRGLVINRFEGSGIWLDTSGGSLIEGNYIGTDVNGTADLGNSLAGVSISSVPNNTIGGTAAGAGNVISGNGWYGVEINGTAATGNLVQGNYIGPDVNGTTDLGNSSSGVHVFNAPNNTIGGTVAGAGTVISGNDGDGVYIFGNATAGNVVQGNYIGTDATGTVGLGNSSSGVLIFNAPNNTIGGMMAGAGNVISDNDNDGVTINAAASNVVQGNYIGTDVTGTADLGNSRSGVYIYNAPNNAIGGMAVGARNVISGNDWDGVYIHDNAAAGNVVQGNYIGTDVTGTADLGNSVCGVLIFNAPNNTIGGTMAGARNVISGNNMDGVFLAGHSTAGSVVQGNYIGSDATGAAALGNSRDGVRIEDAHNNAIGGTVAGAGNIISGNDRHGIFIWTAIGGNVVQGNYIGTDVTGTVGLGNSGDGVFIIDTPNSTIGGTVAGARNLISDNGEYGVHIVGGTGHRVQGNYIGTDVNGAADLGNSQSGVFINNASDTTIGGTVAEAKPHLGQ